MLVGVRPPFPPVPLSPKGSDRPSSVPLVTSRTTSDSWPVKLLSSLWTTLFPGRQSVVEDVLQGSGKRPSGLGEDNRTNTPSDREETRDSHW